jgi:hypothetical protein
MPWPGTETPGGIAGLGSKSYKELKLENEITAMQGRLKESESICSAQKEQIENLHWNLFEANRSIKDLENRNSHIKVALAVLGILFTSSLIIISSHYQISDLFIPYYAASKSVLNALLANPLFHKI